MTDAMRELSVVIPFRSEPVISETVRAILSVAQSEGIRDFEVIVVGSGDPGDLPKDAAVRFVETEPNLWASSRRNRGLATATGNIVVFLDADCIPQFGWFGGVRASQKPVASICCGSIVVPSDNYWQQCYNLAGFREYLDGLPGSERRFLPSFCLWGPRAAFVEVGGFDEARQTAEDLDLTIRLARAGWSLRFKPTVRIVHRPVANSLTQLIGRGWLHGGWSIAVRREHPDVFRTGVWGTSPIILVLGSLLAAGYFLAKTYLDYSRLRTICLACALPIYFYRVAWCLGAAYRRVLPRSTPGTASRR
ncbi:MAG TPA: glycosyltransferase [Chloroflexota bacterium]|nr:glycosyltransferase [Chloroflexota bacterium]